MLQASKAKNCYTFASHFVEMFGRFLSIDQFWWNFVSKNLSFSEWNVNARFILDSCWLLVSCHCCCFVMDSMNAFSRFHWIVHSIIWSHWMCIWMYHLRIPFNLFVCYSDMPLNWNIVLQIVFKKYHYEFHWCTTIAANRFVLQ